MTGLFVFFGYNPGFIPNKTPCTYIVYYLVQYTIHTTIRKLSLSLHSQETAFQNLKSSQNSKEFFVKNDIYIITYYVILSEKCHEHNAKAQYYIIWSTHEVKYIFSNRYVFINSKLDQDCTEK